MVQTGKLVIGLLASTLTAAILGNLVSSQFVIAGLNDIGANLTFANRLSMTGSDVIGFGPMYAIFICIGFAIAFLAGWLVYKIAKTGRTLVYSAAGMAAMIIMLYMMKNVFFGVQPVAGARSLMGLVAQGVVGGIAGYLFARITAPKTNV